MPKVSKVHRPSFLPQVQMGPWHQESRDRNQLRAVRRLLGLVSAEPVRAPGLPEPIRCSAVKAWVRAEATD